MFSIVEEGRSFVFSTFSYSDSFFFVRCNAFGGLLSLVRHVFLLFLEIDLLGGDLRGMP